MLHMHNGLHRLEANQRAEITGQSGICCAKSEVCKDPFPVALLRIVHQNKTESTLLFWSNFEYFPTQLYLDQGRH